MKKIIINSAVVLVTALVTIIFVEAFLILKNRLIINYDIPKDKANYIHRIGRSGRFGRKGFKIIILCDQVTAF